MTRLIRMGWVLLGLGALLVLAAVGGVLYHMGVDQAFQSVANGLSRPQVVLTNKHEMPGGFYCLGDTLIYAPKGLVVYGTVPPSLTPCSPSTNPLAGAEKGRNYLIETQGGWVWNPKMSGRKR